MDAADEQLIRNYLAGERRAYTTVDEWIQAAGRSFQRRLGHRWEDVLQEMRTEVHRLLGRGTFRGDSSLRTYIWRVACHSCVDQVRRESRTGDRLVDLDEREPGMPSLPATAGQRAEDKDLLLRVLEEMSEECRRLWQLLADGWSYREMSRELGASEGALRVRVLRCRQRASEVRDRLSGVA